MQERALYPIGVVSELIDIPCGTLRVWDKNDVIHPRRRSGRRFFSESDLKRLQFIKELTSEGLNLPAIRHYLQLYPCWQLDDCPSCMHSSKLATCAKPCWKEEGSYCQASGSEDSCLTCEFCKEELDQWGIVIESAELDSPVWSTDVNINADYPTNSEENEMKYSS